MSTSIAAKSKIIRDAVHGDICLPGKFMQIVDTPEFQRLRRIRQLGTAYLLFPTAEHTRFSHSIGTFYTMRLLIDHFKTILKKLGLKITEQEENLALCVALLHDIGHGPFSHAFENLLPKHSNQKNHEQWTVDIITSKQSNINKVLRANFNHHFPKLVASLIMKEYEIEKSGVPKKTKHRMHLVFILSSLISSQLDADRMDYLLRDAYFTGVSYGKFDLSRLINSLTLTVHNNNYYVCVHEKYLPSIEEYLLARFHMHNGVYLHRFKCEMELIVKKIIWRAHELYKSQKLSRKAIPDALTKMFEDRKLTIEDYMSLDDMVMLSLFSQWKKGDDIILATLCLALLDRNKFRELNISDNSENSIIDFESRLVGIFKHYGYKMDNLDESYFWIRDEINSKGYSNKKENIWVLKNNGTVVDLSKTSSLTEKLLNIENRYITYISFDILRLSSLKSNINETIKDIEGLIDQYNIRKHIEIEKKYVVKSRHIFDMVRGSLSDWEGYIITEGAVKEELIDVYYDTLDDKLNESNITIRIRKKPTTNILTIKMPPSGKGNLDNRNSSVDQNARYEHETPISSVNIEDAKDIILKHVCMESKPVDTSQLVKKMEILTKREKITVTKAEIKIDIVFDDILYKKLDKTVSDYQIELELKSDILHRINLKMISDYLESRVPELTPTQESKYKRGLQLIGN